MGRTARWEFEVPSPDDGVSIRWAVVEIDAAGNVTASYELLAQLLAQLGGKESVNA